jgi:hypothetical protein
MKAIFPSLIKGHTKLTDRDDHLLQIKPKNISECINLAKEAIDLGRFKERRSKTLWLNIISASRRLNIELRQVVEARLSDGKTILETCIKIQDWDSCRELVFALPEGRYCDDRILRKSHALILDEDGPEKQRGIIVTPEGSYYAGELSSNKMHGQGIITSAGESVFEGTWKKGQMHGWGIYRNVRSQRISHEGLFVEGRWLGDTRPIKPSRVSRIKGYFFK